MKMGDDKKSIKTRFLFLFQRIETYARVNSFSIEFLPCFAPSMVIFVKSSWGEGPHYDDLPTCFVYYLTWTYLTSL